MLNFGGKKQHRQRPGMGPETSGNRAMQYTEKLIKCWQAPWRITQIQIWEHRVVYFYTCLSVSHQRNNSEAKITISAIGGNCPQQPSLSCTLYDFACIMICLSICLSACLPVCLSVCLTHTQSLVQWVSTCHSKRYRGREKSVSSSD